MAGQAPQAQARVWPLLMVGPLTLTSRRQRQQQQLLGMGHCREAAARSLQQLLVALPLLLLQVMGQAPPGLSSTP